VAKVLPEAGGVILLRSALELRSALTVGGLTKIEKQRELCDR
jgi:hypothetical protein